MQMSVFLFDTDLYFPSDATVWCVMLAYTCGILIMPPMLTTNFGPWVTRCSMVQNMGLTVCSGIMLCHLIYYAVQGWMTVGLQQTMCAEYTTWYAVTQLRYWTWIFYVTKYVELLDTLWLVLKHKPITWLHSFHHALVIYFFHFLLIRDATFIWMAAIINTAVHTIMYYYFFYMEWTKTHPSQSFWPNPVPFKKVITWLQIRQFYLDIFLGVMVAFGVPYCRHRLWAYFAAAGVVWSITQTLLIVGFPLSLIGFFNHYYSKQYSRSIKK
jgi:hypothetical protein